MGFPDIIVSGAGSPYCNGVYIQDGYNEGKPLYSHYEEDGTVAYLYWYVNRWAIVMNYECYKSYDDVATPDLATTWELSYEGILPIPTVSKVVPPPLFKFRYESYICDDIHTVSYLNYEVKKDSYIKEKISIVSNIND